MTCGLATALEPPHFNPRTRVGCDTMTSQFCRHFVRVSIHAPAWGATSLASHADASATAVSIHAPAWGATPSCRPSPAGIPCFNPRTRVGCDLRRLGLHHDAIIVSIHAPAWGATPAPDLRIRGRVVSIHAPAWGATGGKRQPFPADEMFQSTHPRGVRPIKSSIARKSERFQSTHPRGVRRVAEDTNVAKAGGFNPRTRVGCDHGCNADAPPGARFNPRTRVGCDYQTQAQITAPSRFQSTHPRGVRRAGARKRDCKRAGFQSTHPRGVRPRPKGDPFPPDAVSIHAPAWGATRGFRPLPTDGTRFNPRTRVGCDPQPGQQQGQPQQVSIHAPAWGATGRLRFADVRDLVSIHAPAWGATAPSALSRKCSSVSIHAPAWGATADGRAARRAHRSFNPRTRVGCDPTRTVKELRDERFNPRTRVGCDMLLDGKLIFPGEVSIHAPAWGATRAAGR